MRADSAMVVAFFFVVAARSHRDVAFAEETYFEVVVGVGVGLDGAASLLHALRLRLLPHQERLVPANFIVVVAANTFV